MRATRCPTPFFLALLALLAAGPAGANEPDPAPPPGGMLNLPTFEPLAGLSVNVSIGSAWQEVSKVSQGTIVVGPNNEQPLATLDGRIATTRIAGGATYAWGDVCCAENFRTSFEFDTSWGDETVTRASEAGGGQDTAITWFDFAPSGTTGILLGNTGLFARQELKLDTHDLRISSEWDYDICDAADVTLSPKVSLIYGKRQQIAYGGATSLQDPNIQSRTEQRVVDEYHGVGLGFGARYEFFESLELTGSAGFDLMYHDAKARIQQSNQCNNPGCPPGDTQFGVNLTRDFDGFAWGSRLDVGAAWRSGGLSLGTNLGLRYLSDRGDLVNPSSPPFPPFGNHTFFVRDDALEPYFAFNVKYDF